MRIFKVNNLVVGIKVIKDSKNALTQTPSLYSLVSKEMDIKAMRSYHFTPKN